VKGKLAGTLKNQIPKCAHSFIQAQQPRSEDSYVLPMIATTTSSASSFHYLITDTETTFTAQESATLAATGCNASEDWAKRASQAPCRNMARKHFKSIYVFKGDGWGFKARKEGAAEAIGVRALSN